MIFLTMLLFLSMQISVFATDTNATVKIPVEQIFGSENTDVPDEFIYVLTTDQADAPMPAGSSNQRYIWKMKGNASTDLTINVKTSGQYQYKIYQATEKRNNFQYDERSYDVTVEAFYHGKNNQLRAMTVVENQNGEKVSDISFENSYIGKGKFPNAMISKISKSNRVKTGDENPVVGYVILLLSSVICLIAMILEKQRKKKGDA